MKHITNCGFTVTKRQVSKEMHSRNHNCYVLLQKQKQKQQQQQQ